MGKRFMILAVICAVFFAPPIGSQENTVVEVKVKRVMLDHSTRTPTAVVILESVKEKKIVPIWIGNEEATSIAIELESIAPPRPNTHDLIRNIFQGVGAVLQRITITDLKNNVYYATLSLKLKGQEYQIDSRPSDAIAVALRMKAPIYASSQVVSKAVQIPSLEKGREDTRKILGIHLQDLTPELASLFDLQVKGGVLVADVEAKSPAAASGVQRGDIIVKANDRAVHKAGELETFLRNLKKPAQVKLELSRKGKNVTAVFDVPAGH
ncbi:MAG: bifunctional nuclease family protein [Deltaproteobacteria bacterium]|nr:bifunctional nuclease family protein [Deltaproteobacteria bacterium]